MDYIIGDVQGCYNTLQQLLNKNDFNEDRDQLFFLGVFEVCHSNPERHQ